MRPPWLCRNWPDRSAVANRLGTSPVVEFCRRARETVAHYVESPTYVSTGGIVATATTSLPYRLYGVSNWDCRCRGVAAAFFRWLGNDIPRVMPLREIDVAIGFAEADYRNPFRQLPFPSLMASADSHDLEAAVEVTSLLHRKRHWYRSRSCPNKSRLPSPFTNGHPLWMAWSRALLRRPLLWPPSPRRTLRKLR